jgi:acetyl-CoA acetyltransferase
MGIGPVPACLGLLDRLNIRIQDITYIEINEAFAPQTLAVIEELKLNQENTNVDGGAIAIGHPLAASGTRLVTHLLYRLRHRGGGLGLASACIGGGQGMAVLVKV